MSNIFKSQPNIVWLLTDHNVFKYHGSNGGPVPEMPNFQNIASQGISFPNAYSACPLCTPARASMLTGQYPHKHGLVQNDGACNTHAEFDQNTKLFNYYLQNAGYRCGYFGKWHCGNDYIAKDYGFEGWSLPKYGRPYISEKYDEYLKELNLPEPIVNIEWYFNDPKHIGSFPLKKLLAKKYWRLSSGVFETPLETHESFFVTHLACKWLEERANKNERFCLRVDPWGPHQPYYVAKPFANTIDNKSIPEYPNFSHNLNDRPKHHREHRDMVHKQIELKTWDDWQPIVARCYEQVKLVDTALGRVLDTLNRLGLSENTLVIYTADHGDGIGSSGGILDKDAMMTEETMRIPLAISWAGLENKSTKCNAMVSNMDIVPTILDAAGISENLDGDSLFKFIQDTSSWREDIMCEHHGHGTVCFQRYLRYKNYVYIAHLDDIDELYDIENDPFQLKNKINDTEMKPILNEMKKRLYKQMEKYKDNELMAEKLKEKKLNNL